MYGEQRGFMRKTLIAALFLLLSASSFATDSETETMAADNEEIGEFLSAFLPAGTNVGSCKITRSEPSKELESDEYLLDVESDNNKISMVVSNGGQIVVTSSETDGIVVIDTSSEVIKKGLKTTQELNFKAAVTQKEDGVQERILELSIVTKSQKTKGILKSTTSKTLNCGTTTEFKAN